MKLEIIMEFLILVLPESPEAMVATIYLWVKEGLFTVSQYLEICGAVGACVGA